MSAFKKLGHSVNRYHLSDSTDLEGIVSTTTDIAIVMDWKGIDIPQTVKQFLKDWGTYLIRECGDMPQNFDKHLPCCEGYDLLLSPDYTSTQKLKALGYNAVHFPHWAFSELFESKGEPDTHTQPIRCTRGPGSSHVLDTLSQIMPDKFSNKNGMYGYDYGMFLQGGLITVQHSRFGEVTRRVFEGMLAGTLAITDRLLQDTHIDDLFTEGKDILYYDGIPDLIGKLNYYLSPQGRSERLRISEAGYYNALNNHTELQRAQQILSIYEK